MLLHGRDLSPEAAKARREAEVRGGRKEGLNRPDRTPVEDAEGHAGPAPAATAGGRRLDGEGRDRPRPLRALPPASGNRRRDPRRDLLQTDASASRRDPASPGPAEGRADGLAVLRRLPRRGAAAACARSRSCLNGGHRGKTRGDVCVHGGIVVTDALVSARQRPPQFPLRSYTPRQFPLRPYTVGIRRFIDTQQYKEALRTFVLI